MKIILLFSIVLSFALASLGQSTVIDLKTRAKTEKLKDLIITYDKFKDKAQVATKPQNLIGSWEGGMAIFATGMVGPNKAQTLLFLTIGYEFKGENLDKTPTHYAVIFESNSSDWNFLKGDRNLYIFYDEKRLELAPLAADSEIKWSRISPSVSVSESLGFGITRADLEEIMKAKKVEFKLGDTKPREWKSDWSKRINALLKITEVAVK